MLLRDVPNTFHINDTVTFTTRLYATCQKSRWKYSFRQALTFDDRASVADTLEACSPFDILKVTEINEDVRAFLLPREGFNLGSRLPTKSHFAMGPKTDEIKDEVIKAE